jgi:hypothetical protein
VVGKELRVRGYLFGRDFPDVVQQIAGTAAGAMGMSYELADAHVADMRAEVWTLTKATFTGAAVLLREKAAYQNTSFRLLDNHRSSSRLPQRLAAGTSYFYQHERERNGNRKHACFAGRKH